MTTVLIVDDNEINRHLAAHVLEHRGFAVLTASDGVEALRIVCEQLPQVVVLDIQMPGLSGLDVITSIRRSPDPVVAQTRIIAATALAAAGDRKRCIETGADRFLPRPFSIKQLVAEVQSLAGGPHLPS